MTSEEALERARAGDLVALGADRAGLGSAVKTFCQNGDAASALELVGRAWRVWLSQDALGEGSAMAAAALSTPGAVAVPVWRVRTLYGDGVLAFRAGDTARSLDRNQEALDIARAAGDLRGECDALTGLARIALRDGRYDDVVALAVQARERAQQGGDCGAEAAPLHLHAAGVRLQGDHAAARNLYLESLELNVSLGDARWVAMEQHNLGWVELHLGDVDSAEARFASIEPQAGDAYGKAWDDLYRAATALARGRRDEARQRFGAGAKALEALHATLDPDDQAEFDWLASRLGGPSC